MFVWAVFTCYLVLASRWVQKHQGSMSLRLSSSWTLGKYSNAHPYQLVLFARTASEQCLSRPHNLQLQHPHPHCLFRTFILSYLPYSAPQTRTSGQRNPLPALRFGSLQSKAPPF